MPKIGVLSVSPYSICEPVTLKRLFLMFDKIYIEKDALEIARMTKEPISNYSELAQEVEGDTTNAPEKTLVLGDLLSLNQFDAFEDNFRNINYLQETGFIEVKDLTTETMPSGNEAFAHYSHLLSDLQDEFKAVNSDLKQFLQQFSDAKARILSLTKVEEAQTVPILLNYPNNPKLGINTQVFRFLLPNFPEPDDTVSWEQLSDFKNDPDSMVKYYGLVDWINEIARKDYKLYEIEDKFKFLYHQYAEHYRGHKVKMKRGVFELLVTASLDCLAGNLGVPGLSSNLFSWSRMNVNLLEAEQKFEGREVGYIYKTNRIFGK